MKYEAQLNALKNEAVGEKIRHKAFGAGVITDIDVRAFAEAEDKLRSPLQSEADDACRLLQCETPDFAVTVDFQAFGTKKLVLGYGVSKGLLTFEGGELTKLNRLYNDFLKAWAASADERKALCDDYLKEKEARLEAEYEAKKKAEEAEELKKKIEKSVSAFNDINGQVRLSDSDIDWLRSHVISIRASLPDYLLPAFRARFGAYYEPVAVDSSRRTSTGYKMKYTCSFTLYYDAGEEVPAGILRVSRYPGLIANTALIFGLVEDYGFRFGKSENQKKPSA